MKPTLELIIDTAKPFCFETYLKNQMNYVQDLWEQAREKGDCLQYKKTSDFMLGEYFKWGYDVAYRKYYCGMIHKPKWGDLCMR